MKAMVYTEYGSPERLRMTTLAKPIPNDHEVLIKVHAVSINDWDLALLNGTPFINRLMNGLTKPKKTPVLGSDIAGEVVAVGKDAQHFKVGDQVFGDLCGKGWGGFAEFVCASEKLLTHKPASLSFEQAASLPQAGLLALQGLRIKNFDAKHKHILINGAGGGAGSFAIQIAKHLGAYVTAVDAGSKFEIMRSLGADHVIDYTQQDFTQNVQKYDLILDFMGYHSIFDYRRALTSNGRYLMVGGCSSLIFQSVLLGPILSLFDKKKLGILAHQANVGIGLLIELVTSGKVVPVIDQCFSLQDLPQAMTYFAARKTKGKIIITVKS
jgi:NADPH:quinone reductase-like Zn-dependent oxidoreductase